MDLEKQEGVVVVTPEEVEVFDYAKRAQWLRAAVLGANDGLLSTASLMMGVGAVKQDVKTMILTGVAGLVAGACSMAIGEFVSVYSQYDIEHKNKLPNPYTAAMASAVAFSVGALVPLLAAAFIKDYKVFGGVGAVLGKAPFVKSSLRVLIGGWLAMAVTFGLTKLAGHVGV
ncbi:hypothetical protein Ahy_A10g050759 isoform A [Arachis hypogaea]|uniref:Vacuolar iron transporter n=1 Tax=Arachis hypogaea TaxID=3818 RepID=A0A445BAB4_ARAHY|nr:hypothetical protein Ahy_A10g050759 isoform A [Arachis hypogaea]